MNEERYTLEWRGTKKGPWTLSEIEQRLDDGDIHSLHKIRVDGRSVVLRDFLEDQRQARKKAAAAEQTAVPAMPAYAAPPPVYHPAQAAQEPHYPAQEPHYPAKRKKNRGRMPALILGGVGIAVIAIAAGYLFAHMSATSRSDDKHTTTTTTTTATAAAAATATESKPEEKPRHAKLQPLSITGKEIYPSALISTATVDWNGDVQSAEDKKTEDDAQIGKRDLPLYGDENSWLGIELEGLKKGDQVSVEITADGFMKPSKWQGQITALSQDGFAQVMPKVMWDYEALMKVRQQRPINVIFSASIDGKPLPDVTETYTLRSINDCPLLLKDRSGKGWTDLSFLFAAYVNENHPQVQEILKEALECGMVKQFDGYQTKEPKEVLNQVFSVWNALQRRGIKYSDVTTTPPGDRVVSQSVRFLQESINNHQANCVDGTVLMASVLQKIGIQSYLVLVPSHCFLAFDLVPNSAALPTGLETTMLGNNNISDVKKMEFLSNVEQTKENDASVKTFSKALDVGSSRIQGCARNLQGQGNSQYRLISIEDARNDGINPIPFTTDK